MAKCEVNQKIVLGGSRQVEITAVCMQDKDDHAVAFHSMLAEAAEPVRTTVLYRWPNLSATAAEHPKE